MGQFSVLKLLLWNCILLQAADLECEGPLESIPSPQAADIRDPVAGPHTHTSSPGKAWEEKTFLEGIPK